MIRVSEIGGMEEWRNVGASGENFCINVKTLVEGPRFFTCIAGCKVYVILFWIIDSLPL